MLSKYQYSLRRRHCKPRSTPRATISVKVEPEHAEKFRAICKAEGKSQSEQITDWIKHAPK